MLFERGIRGGITHTPKRYAVANNKYMKNYKPDEDSSFIQYLDANNLYGCAMSQQLPTHGFKWIKNITKESVIEILDKANYSTGRKGYILIWSTHNNYGKHITIIL